MVKNKNKHNLWKRLRFKYRISVLNENTLEEVWKMKTSIFSGIVAVVVFAFALIAATSIIIIATPIRYYLPGYMDAEIRGQAITTSIKIDSVENVMKQQEIYLQNLKNIFAGVIDPDSTDNLSDTILIDTKNPLLLKTEKEKEFSQRYEQTEKYNLSVLPVTSTMPTGEVIFFKPVQGAITKSFSPSTGQFGTEISIVPQSTVSSVLEGTVLFAGYDINSGYTIQIQHSNGFISIYKNNTLLLKKTGDKVSTGEAIATIGDKDDKSNTNFTIELWYKGNAVNPENYIIF